MSSGSQSLLAGSRPPVASIDGFPLAEHDHLCVFYRGRAERDRLLLSFLEDGLRAGHTCLCITGSGEHKGLAAALSDVASDDPSNRGELQLSDPRTTYLNGGTFAAEPMLEMLYDWASTEFQQKGCTFARGVGDMSWAQPFVSAPFLDDLASYEARLTLWTRAFPQVTVCMYDLERFTGDVVVPVLRTHPKVWLSGVLVENPYYLEADELLSLED